MEQRDILKQRNQLLYPQVLAMHLIAFGVHHVRQPHKSHGDKFLVTRICLVNYIGNCKKLARRNIKNEPSLMTNQLLFHNFRYFCC